MTSKGKYDINKTTYSHMDITNTKKKLLETIKHLDTESKKHLSSYNKILKLKRSIQKEISYYEKEHKD